MCCTEALYSGEVYYRIAVGLSLSLIGGHFPQTTRGKRTQTRGRHGRPYGCQGNVHKMAERKGAHGQFPSIFDADSDDESDPDETYRKLNRDDTGPSLLPLNVSLAYTFMLAMLGRAQSIIIFTWPRALYVYIL